MAKLGWPEEVFYRRLMSVVDDFGRYYADAGLLRGHCYPRQLNKVSDSDIEKWLRACVDAALVRVYPAKDGERYLELLDFRQQVRAKESKFPEQGSACIADAAQASTGGTSSAPVFVSVFGVESVPSAGKPAMARFEDFYNAYPRKMKPRDARKAWDRIRPTAALLQQMLKSLDEQKRSPQWLKDGGQFIPYPASWLNSGSWENDIGVAETASAWDACQSSIVAKGVELGVGTWDRDAFDHGRGETFMAYTARVRRAVEGQDRIAA